jgi:Uma2 family endonuclease
MNLGNALFNHLRRGPCNVHMSDVKVRLEVNREAIFYYPDIMVACVRDGVETYYLRYPKLIVELLSESTEAIGALKIQNSKGPNAKEAPITNDE